MALPRSLASPTSSSTASAPDTAPRPPSPGRLTLLPAPSHQSPPIFQTAWLDRLSRTPWFVVPTLFVPAALGLWLWGASLVGAGAALGLAAAGALAWTLAEYWLHRTLFHWQPKSPWGPRLHFFLHGVHHAMPHDPYRLVMPLFVSIPLFFAFLGFWQLTLGPWAPGFHAGFVLGYVAYDLTHYFVHHGRPRSRWMRLLRGHHMSHHFNRQQQERRFGVSTRLWDRVFGTL